MKASILSNGLTGAFFAAAQLQLAAALYINGSVIAPCDSPIYCYGDLLREIELARPFSDSKTFVDLCVEHRAIVSPTHNG